MKRKIISVFFAVLLVQLQACGDAQNDSENVSSASAEIDEAIVDEVKVPLEPQPVSVDPVNQSVLDQNEKFEEFKETLLEKFWELNPGRAVYSGFYKYDDQLKIPNGVNRAAQRSFYVNELQALRQFDANQLTSENSADLAIIEAELKSYLWYIDEFRSYEWNPAQYNPAGPFGVILNTDYKPLDQRLLVIAKRLENVPAYYATAINNIKVPTLEHVDLAIQQSAGTLKMFDELIPEKLEQVDLPDTVKSDISEKLLTSSASVKSYIQWLKDKKAELTSEFNDISPRDFRIGVELYEKKFKHDIGSEYTAEELYQLAVKAKEKLHRQMTQITSDLWPTYFPDSEKPENDLESVKILVDKLSEKHVDRDQFVDEIKRQIPIIQKFMDDNKLLDSDPTRPLVVRLTPEYQRGIAGASINAPGPYDATANTYYNVSPLDAYTDEQAESYLREYNHWILQILNIHEAIPGHYTQLVHANKSPSKIKSIFANGAMIEGWAVYSERMMLEEGYAENEPEMWLMYSKWNLRVVVNTILDYSVQVLGMEKQEALDLLINEAFQQQTEAEGKWRRATLSQVQLTSYFSGYSEIYAFREQQKAALGSAFDLRDFHNTFLSYGNAPVSVIKKLMLLDAQVPSEPLDEFEELEIIELEPELNSPEPQQSALKTVQKSVE